jgi:hypothetical protein
MEFKAISGDLKAKMPGFMCLQTNHFVLVYNTSDTYARWVGELFEKLYRTFFNFWKSKGVKLNEPRFLMVALLFDTRDAYLQYAQREIGDSAQAMIGYYNMQTNRVVTFDITGLQGLAQPGKRYDKMDMLNQLFAQPQAERTVATIVHEAVHQIAYNTGLQVRLADNPKWVSEGLAMFFETPDLRNPKSGGTVGQVNNYQLIQFAKYLSQRPNNSLSTLISDDERFNKKEDLAGAYAESWALTYFLLSDKSHASDFAAYLKEMSKLPPLGESDARHRVELFKKHFGSNLTKLDSDFVEFLRRRAR